MPYLLKITHSIYLPSALKMRVLAAKRCRAKSLSSRYYKNTPATKLQPIPCSVSAPLDKAVLAGTDKKKKKIGKCFLNI